MALHPTVKAKVVELLGEGLLPWRQIAIRVGVSRGTVYNIAKQIKVKPRRPGGRPSSSVLPSNEE